MNKKCKYKICYLPETYHSTFDLSDTSTRIEIFEKWFEEMYDEGWELVGLANNYVNNGNSRTVKYQRYIFRKFCNENIGL